MTHFSSARLTLFLGIVLGACELPPDSFSSPAVDGGERSLSPPSLRKDAGALLIPPPRPQDAGVRQSPAPTAVLSENPLASPLPLTAFRDGRFTLPIPMGWTAKKQAETSYEFSPPPNTPAPLLGLSYEETSQTEMPDLKAIFANKLKGKSIRVLAPAKELKSWGLLADIEFAAGGRTVVGTVLVAQQRGVSGYRVVQLSAVANTWASLRTAGAGFLLETMFSVADNLGSINPREILGHWGGSLDRFGVYARFEFATNGAFRFASTLKVGTSFNRTTMVTEAVGTYRVDGQLLFFIPKSCSMIFSGSKDVTPCGTGDAPWVTAVYPSKEKAGWVISGVGLVPLDPDDFVGAVLTAEK